MQVEPCPQGVVECPGLWTPLSSELEVSDAALPNRISPGVPATDGRACPICTLAREFEPTAQSISTWVKQAERDTGE